MPFLAACTYCPNKLNVPDQALGACLRCPKCGNYFTVAPVEMVAPITNPRRPAVVRERPAAPAETTPPAGDLPWWVAQPPATPPPAPPEPPPSPPAVRTPALALPELPPPPALSSLPGRFNAWGAVAFCFAALALLLAAFTLPRWLTISFAAIGSLLGLAGIAALREDWKTKDKVWLAVGGGISGLVLLLAVFWPSWLNDRWGMDFAVPEPDQNKQWMVSRDNGDEGKELGGGDRVDARTHAIRQGDMLLRVESAVVERVPGQDQPVLLVALHIANVGPLHDVMYYGQASGEHPAIVRDSRGKELPRRDLGEQAKKAGQVGTLSILPLHDVKDLVAVEAPWSGTSHVEVDLPAAAWGREGACKFTIPATFIVRKNRGK